MATWTMTIDYGTRADYVFGIMPDFQPTWEPAYNDAKPAQIIGVKEVWEITNAYILAAGGGTGTMVDAFKTNLVTNLMDAADPPIAFIAKLDGAEKFKIDSSSYHEFRIEHLSAPFDKAHGASNIVFDLRISAILRKAAGGSGTISKLKQTLERTGENGFEVRTLRTEVETTSGSARDQALALGILTLPSDKWEYVTDNGENVHTTVEDYDDDTKATGICTIREQAESIPSGVAHYGTRQTVSESKYKTTRTYYVQAQGTNAEAVVRDAKPSGGVKEASYDIDNRSLTASATYVVEEESEDGKTIRRREFTITPGCYPETRYAVPGTRKSWKLLRPWRPCIVNERLTLRVLDVTEASDIMFDDLLWPAFFKLDESSYTGPHIVEEAQDETSEWWEASAARVYVFDDGTQVTMASLVEATKNLGSELADQADWERPEFQAAEEEAV